MVYIVGVGGTLRTNSRSFVALEYAMAAAQAAGAETELMSLHELDLPMYHPNKKESDYGDNVNRLLGALRRADGVLFSTGAYHGTLAGVTKNMLDFIEYMHHDAIPFLYNRPVGLIATAGGAVAGVHTMTTLIHTIHALRGIVVPLAVPIGSGAKAFEDGKLIDEGVQNRLQQLAQETVQLARVLRPAAATV
jgi:FMN reductase